MQHQYFDAKFLASRPDLKAYADSLLLTPPNQLTEIQGLFRQEYRPLSWREFLRVDSSPQPWAKTVQVNKLVGYAPRPIPANEIGPNNWPQAQLETSSTSFNLFEFINGYGYTDGELVYAQHLGIALDAERANAIGRADEEFFEDIAANGDGTYFTVGLLNQTTGSGNATLVTELPKAAGSGNTGWFDLSSGLATATALEMAMDLVYLCQQLRQTTLTRNRATDIVMAEALYDVAGRTTTGTDNTRTALDIFAETAVGRNVQVRPWYKCDTHASYSNKHLIMALDASDPNGPRMVTPLEPTQGQPWRTRLGWDIPVHMKTGGVQVNKRETIAYMTPTNQA
jgi:hypothetical protein